ncbi:hypothetical protein N7463_000455 [Penicillium fimorum]|uniref:Uncharacterized protein n=1 Tax=Penicillium fimorum TaxID=1882269 RepID=A0A9X0CBJ1_9EURO|nr:hypothetical protein N7463_000455 [Penicillium fimorum]
MLNTIGRTPSFPNHNRARKYTVTTVTTTTGNRKSRIATPFSKLHPGFPGWGFDRARAVGDGQRRGRDEILISRVYTI